MISKKFIISQGACIDRPESTITRELAGKHSEDDFTQGQWTVATQDLKERSPKVWLRQIFSVKKKAQIK